MKSFKCKCGYETDNSYSWCVHADSCNGISKNEPIKPKNQNPNGLHQKYYVHKINQRDGSHEPINKEAEYFVLRLDNKAEKNHRNACLKAVLAYAEAIKDFLPVLSEDLIERYNGKH